MEYKNNDKICHTIMYEHYNKITKNNDQLSMYIIMTKAMSEELRNNKIYQYFWDATYRCVPPTFRSFKLYVISGFNTLDKRTRILSFILISNETLITYYTMFDKLKTDYGFNPKIFTIDFNKASAKALKQVFPQVYIVKCFFHFVNCLGKYLKKYSL